MKKKTIKKISKNFLSVALGATQVVVDGLSSVRQIGDFTSASWAKGVSGSASVVEGEIYRKNIFEGLGLFGLLSKKGLSEYLIRQALETELNFIDKSEEEIKDKLYDFFLDIKEGRICELDDEERNALDEINYGENSALSEEKVVSLFSCFKEIKKNRDGISGKFIDFDVVTKLKLLEEAFKNFQKIKKESNCAFLTSYKANKILLETAESLGLEKSEIEQAEKRLKVLQKMLVERVSASEKSLFTQSDDINPELFKKLEQELAIGKGRLWPLRLGMLFSASTGVALGIVTFYTFPAVLTGLGLSLSLTALSAIMWPLAILAAISYGILIYNTLADLIVNETLSKWWKALNEEIGEGHHPLKYAFCVVTKTLSQIFIKLAQWFRVKPEENGFAYGLRILLSVLMLSFAVMAALTTGYTVFNQLEGYLSVVVGVIIALPLMISDLTFTLKNSFESIALLSGISLANLTDPIKAGWKNLQEQLKTENYLQLTLYLLRLPLELLLSVFKATIFFLHVVFISVASDRLFSLPCWVTLIFTAGSEFLTDICPIFGKKEAGAGHDHDHGGIINWIAKAVFFAPATALGLLNYLFSQLNRFSAELKVLGCWEAIQQEWNQFDIRHLHEEKGANQQNRDSGQEAQLPNQIVLQKAIKICDKQIDRLDHGFFNGKLAQEKKKVFEGYKEDFTNAFREGKSASSIEVKANNILSNHRFFNRSKQTESMRQLEKIQHWLRMDSVDDNPTRNHTGPVLMQAV